MNREKFSPFSEWRDFKIDDEIGGKPSILNYFGITKTKSEPYNFNYIDNRNYGLKTFDKSPVILDDNVMLFAKERFDEIIFESAEDKLLFGDVVFTLLFVETDLFTNPSKSLNWLYESGIPLNLSPEEIKGLLIYLLQLESFSNPAFCLACEVIELGYANIEISDVLKFGKIGWTLYYLTKNRGHIVPKKYIKNTEEYSIKNFTLTKEEYDSQCLNGQYESTQSMFNSLSFDELFKKVEPYLGPLAEEMQNHSELTNLKDYFRITIENSGSSKIFKIIGLPKEEIKEIVEEVLKFEAELKSKQKEKRDKEMKEECNKWACRITDDLQEDVYESVNNCEGCSDIDVATYEIFKKVEPYLTEFIKDMKNNTTTFDIKAYFRNTIEIKGVSEILRYIVNPSEDIINELCEYERLVIRNFHIDKIDEESESFNDTISDMSDMDEM